MATHNELGSWGEELTVVFVEVKTRRNRLFTEPEDAIDYQKLRNLRAAMNHYVKFQRLQQEIRLDVVTVVGTPDNGTPAITHIQDVPMY